MDTKHMYQLGLLDISEYVALLEREVSFKDNLLQEKTKYIEELQSQTSMDSETKAHLRAALEDVDKRYNQAIEARSQFFTLAHMVRDWKKDSFEIRVNKLNRFLVTCNLTECQLAMRLGQFMHIDYAKQLARAVAGELLVRGHINNNNQ